MAGAFNGTTGGRGNTAMSPGGCRLPNGMLSVFDGVLLIIILLMALVGNILVFVAIWRYRVLRNITNTFIASLSAADLLVTLIPIPMTFAAFVCSWLPEEQSSKPQDIAYLICDIMASSVSIMSLMAVAVDRCIAISAPYKYRQILSKTKIIIVIIALWIICFVSALLKLFVPKRKYTLIIIMVTFVIPVLIMLICYGKIYVIARFQAKRIYTLRKSVRKSQRYLVETANEAPRTERANSKKASFSDVHVINGGCKNGTTHCVDDSVELAYLTVKDGDHTLNDKKPSEKRMTACYKSDEDDFKLRKRSTFRNIRNRLSRYSVSEFNRDLKAAKSLAVIMGAFLLTWSPFMAINITFFFCPGCKLNYNLIKYFKFLHFSNSAINPILYALLNKKWRAAFTMMLCRRKSWKKQHHSHSDILSGW